MALKDVPITRDRNAIKSAKLIAVIGDYDFGDLMFNSWAEFSDYLAELGECTERDQVCDFTYLIGHNTIHQVMPQTMWVLCEEIDEEVAEASMENVIPYRPVVI